MENQNLANFEFISNLGGDDSMADYAKMSILFAYQGEFNTTFKKCDAIRKKFEEKYGGCWVVGMFQNSLSDVSASYQQFCLVIKYNNYYFKIFKLR